MSDPQSFLPQLPVAEATEAFETLLANLDLLRQRWAQGKLAPRDEEFASSLINSFCRDLTLSPRQTYWVSQLASRYSDAEPIYGTFNPILVMFRFAQSRGLKRPRVRLLSSDAEPIYFELWFRPGEKDERTIEIMRGGWQGSGRRQFAGWIHDERILPWQKDRITPGMRSVIQDLALDPLGVAKAMAQRLHACMYCGQRLSDDESKARGYGPVCAENWNQPWGAATPSTRQHSHAIRTSTSLEELFS